MTKEVNIFLSGQTEAVTAILKLLSSPVHIIQEVTQESKPDNARTTCQLTVLAPDSDVMGQDAKDSYHLNEQA